jgi:hypothetical protein
VTEQKALPEAKLKAFFETARVARAATNPISKGVAVNIHFVEGVFPALKDTHPPCHFLRALAGPAIVSGEHKDPDFTLFMPAASVDRLIALKSDDPGDFGVEFFKLCMSRDDTEKIRVRVRAGVLRLLSHGYFGVLGLGGRKMVAFLKEKGAFGMTGFKAVIARLRGG